MTPFDFRHYRDFLKTVCKQPTAQRGFQGTLARAAGCQASYFSQVLQGNVHLTEDQAVGIAEKLELSPEETEHFLLLLRLEKAGTPTLKKFLEGRILQSLKKNSRVGQKIPAERMILKDEEIGKYFSSWIPSAVHLLTSNPEYSAAEKIANRLQIPVKNVEQVLTYLKQIDFIEKKNGRWMFKGGAIQVPKDSVWQPAMQSSRRQMALRSIALNSEEAVHFSSVFTIDRKDMDEIKKILKPFLDKSHKIIQNSGSEELCCLCLDLFTLV